MTTDMLFSIFLLLVTLVGSFTLLNVVFRDVTSGIVEQASEGAAIYRLGLTRGINLLIYFMSIFFLILGASVLVMEIKRKPLQPNNVIFIGVDRAQIDDYNKLNKLIEETQSQVVLFGRGLNNKGIIDNVVDHITHFGDGQQYTLIRTWLDANEPKGRPWDSAIVLASRRVAEDPCVFEGFKEQYIAGIKSIIEEKHKGNLFKEETSSLLWEFKTGNLINTSGQRSQVPPPRL